MAKINNVRINASFFLIAGYHDVAITFLLVVGEELGFQIVERLSISHLQEFMAPTMEETVNLLQFMYPLFRRRNPALYSHLMRAELGTIFALPWLITWFGHVLPDYGDVVRLYDFFLAQPPRMPIYLAAAIVLHREKEIVATGWCHGMSSIKNKHFLAPKRDLSPLFV